MFMSYKYHEVYSHFITLTDIFIRRVKVHLYIGLFLFFKYVLSVGLFSKFLISFSLISLKITFSPSILILIPPTLSLHAAGV